MPVRGTTQPSILIVPALRVGEGSGHLKRCLGLARALKGRAAVHIEGHPPSPLGSDAPAATGATSAIEAFRDQLDVPLVGQHELQCEQPPAWQLVVLDRKHTTAADLKRFSVYGPVVLLDDSGQARQYAPYTIDLLPGSQHRSRANVTSVALLDLPAGPRGPLRFPFQKVLVTFGGEDPAGLSLVLLECLVKKGFFRPQDLSVVEGPLFRPTAWPSGVRIIRRPPDLKHLLSDFDCVFTSFGLTCFEALAAGVPVILLNPTKYHRRLSRRAKLPEVGVGRPKVRKLGRMLRQRAFFCRMLDQSRELRGDQERLPELLLSLDPQQADECPCCGSRFDAAAGRFRHKSYFRCRQCCLIYLVGFRRQQNRYGSSYFFEEYRRQYGRTYLEDFEHIKTLSFKRLDAMRRLLPREGSIRLLDVGCAYGAFLDAARERGFDGCGVDVSEEAITYLTNTLKIAGQVASFEESEHHQGTAFDAVTMWYVLEHFRNPALALRTANRSLRQGGVFAFSTPNATGISSLRDPDGFLENSPEDHCTLWSPRAVRRLLPRYGFRVERVVVTPHPQRFPAGLGKIPGCAQCASRLFGLGDTFAVYATKSREV